LIFHIYFIRFPPNPPYTGILKQVLDGLARLLARGSGLEEIIPVFLNPLPLILLYEGGVIWTGGWDSLIIGFIPIEVKQFTKLFPILDRDLDKPIFRVHLDRIA
jgi:hypothetical protein